MKTQVLIAGDVSQIVLTPETDFERAALNSIDAGTNATLLKRGVFSECQGGWLREFDERPNKESLIVVIKPKEASL